MAGVTARQDAPVYAAPAPEYGVAARKYVTEFIGAFFLTFVVGVAALTGSVFVPLAAGATLMVMVYAGGHISGGHYNPAVTMAALVRRRIGTGDAAGYWAAQVTAGVVAAAIARAVVNPAVALGGATGGLFAWPTIWIYLLVELAAGVAAGLAFRALNPSDK